MKRIFRAALPVLLAAAPAAHAQSIGYDEALRAAVAEQPQVRARELQLEARRQAADAADELPDPRLRAGIANLPVTGPDILDPTMMTMLEVGVEQEIPNLAERHARAGIAAADIDFAHAQLARSRYMARLGAGQAWIELAYSQRALVVVNEALDEIRELVPVARSAVASGSARPGESLEIRRAVLEVEDAKTAIEANQDAARAMLVRYIGIENPLATGDIPSIEVDPQRLRSTLERNPEIIVAAAQVQQARAGVALARSEKRPDFGVSASYGVRERQYGDVFTVMGTVTLPLFGKHRQEPRIAAAEADARAASEMRQDRLRDLEAQFEADLAAWRGAHRQWQRSREELLPLARERADLELASFAAGRAELLDAIDAIKALTLLEIEILKREQAAAEAAVELRLTYTEFSR